MSVDDDVVRNIWAGKSHPDIVNIIICCSEDKSLPPYMIRLGG